MPVINRALIDELKATGRLPSPTGVALTILRLTQDEDTTIDEFSRVLQADPALAGRILRYANSSRSSSRRAIVAVSDAVVRLGLRTTSQIALGFSVLSSYRTGVCKSFDYQVFWSRSLATAVAIQAISRIARKMSPEEAFSCGLLSRIGMLALASVHPDGYSRLLQAYNGDPRADLVAMEREAFAVDHNQLSAALFEDWRLPGVYANAVLYHEDPDRGEFEEGSRAHTVAWFLYVAKEIAAVCVAPEETRARLVPTVLSLGERIGIEQADFVDLCDAVGTEWQEWGELLEVTTQTVPSFDLMAQEALDAEDAAADATDAGGLRVLVVDDQPEELESVAKALAASGHTVRTAAGGREALRTALETGPQLILTDWDMPEMSGLELCTALRSAEQTRPLYIILLDESENKDHVVQGYEAGANDYLAKPVDPLVLRAHIQSAQRTIQLHEQARQDKEEIGRYAVEVSTVNRKLEQAALNDVVTHLPNRRYALERVAQEWAAAASRGRDLTCMFADIDHFKKVNETYGREAGDAVLRETATALARAVRKSDVVCRFDGVKFLIIAEDTDAGEAAQLAEQLRKVVEANMVQVLGFTGHVNVSIGVASRSEKIPDPATLLRAADHALKAAKKAGRNRVCVAEGSRAVRR